MSLWAQIKYAMNSTLGTNKFKPLNTLVQDMWDNSMSVVASNEIIKISSKAPITFEKNDQNLILIDEVRCNLDGTITVGVDVETSLSSTYPAVTIEKNGEVISTLNANNATDRNIRLVNVGVSRGDVVAVRKSFVMNGRLTVNYIDFRGTVILRPSFAVFGEVI